MALKRLSDPKFLDKLVGDYALAGKTAEVSRRGKTLLVIGVGHIGGGCARRCRELGMEVLGVSRHGAPVDGGGTIAGDPCQ